MKFFSVILLGLVLIQLCSCSDFSSIDEDRVVYLFINHKSQQIVSMLNNGANPDATIFTEPLVVLASKYNAPDVIAAISTLGGDIEVIHQGKSAWLYAATHGSVEALKQLTTSGANIHTVDKNNYNALHLAAIYDKPQVISYLLESGFEVDSISLNGGTTALMLAAREGNVEAVKILLFHGASWQVQDFQGKNAMDMAANALHQEVVQALVNNL